jgi:TolB-like protein/DNA-binding winged helix-turn-helix (wHTH) protein
MDVPVANEAFMFEGFRLDRRSGGLFRQAESGGAVLVPIGSRALDVLVVLLAHHGELVSKQAIMQAVWPGMVVEEKNLAVQIAAIRRVIDDGREGASCIQTEAGRGYRFVAAVTVGAPEPPLAYGASTPEPRAMQPAQDAVPPSPGAWKWRRRTIAAAATATALCAVVLAALTWNSFWTGSRTATPPRLSIVVLPFQNLSGDPREDYLADGITDDLTTDLSVVPGMFVIARQSAYTYQGRPSDVRTIGRDLGVRYVLEGSVRKLGDELRVNAQLISTDTGAHLWAERFDQPLHDLSAGQTEIVRRIGQAMNVAVMDVESARSRRERPTNPDAFDLILRARSLGLHPMGPREYAERIALFEQALQRDPASILAMTGLAVDLARRTFGFNAADERGRIDKLIADAAAINPTHLGVLNARAYLALQQGRCTEAIAAYQQLLAHYPNTPYAYNQIGSCLTSTGRAAEAIPMIETAMRHEPLGPFAWSRYENLGFALLMLEQDEQAIAWTQRALAANPNNAAVTRAHLNLRIAASKARLGHPDEARRAIAEANRLWPYDTVRAHYPDDPSSRVHAGQIERFQAALRLAGHRDHAEEDADFGVPADGRLRQGLAGLTPTTVPGATTIRTAELQRLLAERQPIVIDPMMYSWGRSIPGAIGLKHLGGGGSLADEAQDRLRRKMQALTKGDLATPIVAAGFNAERFDGYNLALRLVALGYTEVYWYRGGREAWEAQGLTQSAVASQPW